MAIFRREPPPTLTEASNAGRNRDRRDIAGYQSTNCWTCRQQVRRFTVQFTTATATHQWSYIYHSLQHARLRRRQDNRTVYAAVNLKQNLPLMYCTIEANKRHEASRGLFATAELLVIQYVKRNVLLLVTSALDLPLRTIKLCSLLFIVVVHGGCDKQYSLMRGRLCGKLHGRPSQLSFAPPVIDHIFVENHDFCLPHLHSTPPLVPVWILP